jgi:hypothetical protein
MLTKKIYGYIFSLDKAKENEQIEHEAASDSG